MLDLSLEESPLFQYWVDFDLVGVNVSPLFLSLAKRFLHCKIGALLFKYFRLQVGANPEGLPCGNPLWALCGIGFVFGGVGLLPLRESGFIKLGSQ